MFVMFTFCGTVYYHVVSDSLSAVSLLKNHVHPELEYVLRCRQAEWESLA